MVANTHMPKLSVRQAALRQDFHPTLQPPDLHIGSFSVFPNQAKTRTHCLTMLCGAEPAEPVNLQVVASVWKSALDFLQK